MKGNDIHSVGDKIPKLNIGRQYPHLAKIQEMKCISKTPLPRAIYTIP